MLTALLKMYQSKYINGIHFWIRNWAKVIFIVDNKYNFIREDIKESILKQKSTLLLNATF